MFDQLVEQRLNVLHLSDFIRVRVTFWSHETFYTRETFPILIRQVRSCLALSIVAVSLWIYFTTVNKYEVSRLLIIGEATHSLTESQCSSRNVWKVWFDVTLRSDAKTWLKKQHLPCLLSSTLLELVSLCTFVAAAGSAIHSWKVTESPGSVSAASRRLNFDGSSLSKQTRKHFYLWTIHETSTTRSLHHRSNFAGFECETY